MIMDTARTAVVLAGVAVSAMLATVVVLVIGFGTIASINMSGVDRVLGCDYDDGDCYADPGNGE